MEWTQKIKAIFGISKNQQESEFEKTIELSWADFSEKNQNKRYYWTINLNESETWTSEVKNWTDKKKIQFVLWLVPSIHEQLKQKDLWGASRDKHYRLRIKQEYLDSIFKNKLMMDEEDAQVIIGAFTSYKVDSLNGPLGWPNSAMVNQLEKQYKGQPFTNKLREALQSLKENISAQGNYYDQKDRIKLIEKIDGILFVADDTNSVKPVKFLGEDPFAEHANNAIDAMAADEKIIWYKILPLIQKATGSKPSKKFLDETKNLFKELGTDKFKKTVHDWFQYLVNLKERQEQHTYVYGGTNRQYISIDYITPINAEAIKGLIWICSHFHDNATIQTIASLAERAYRKIPNKGPAAASVGNACLYVLYKSKGLDGIGQLSRLKLRIKQASTQAQIDKYLQAAAEEQSVTVEDIEDMAVEDCGLENGSREFLFDDYKAELVITGIGKTEQRWFKPDGTPQKSVPAIVKEKHASKLKKLKDVTKQVEQTLVAQRDRIDRMFRSDRKIQWEEFQRYYLEHGLMCYIANGIIWNFHKQDKVEQAIHLNDHWVNVKNEIIATDGMESVSLWHPVESSVDEIRQWREFFNFHQVKQPLKQAFREVYIVTEAEFNTRSYSNRMAAHILRQHQFNSLAKTRGWRYALMGNFDNGMNGDKATLILPQHNLRAEYWVSEVNANDAMNDTGIWNYISTDQVRFYNTNTSETIDLVDVNPRIFSEVMRDVDLFVGVASVANDPTWQDSGGLPRYHDYWTSYSFGELSEVAKTRKEILSGLVPRLKIKDVATIKDKFLVVKGKLRTYKIHIGSTNILMEPNDQYLCIVPDRGAKDYTENLFIPFEGDSGLSIILSKAFLLAEDDKIKDRTITSQINRK